MGAVASTQIPASLSEVLWLGSDKRGCYTRLDSMPVALLASAGAETHEFEAESPCWSRASKKGAAPVL